MSLKTKVENHLGNNDLPKALEEYYQVFIHYVMQIVLENSDLKYMSVCKRTYPHFYKFAHDMNAHINKYYKRNSAIEYMNDTNNYFRDYMPSMLESKNNITMKIKITFETYDSSVRHLPETYWDISLNWEKLKNM